jgi:hypothetical protein
MATALPARHWISTRSTNQMFSLPHYGKLKVECYKKHRLAAREEPKLMTANIFLRDVDAGQSLGLYQ